MIHVGANTGQERFLYAGYGLKVAWVEPIPDIFRELQSNLTGFPNQTAYNYLIAAQDGIKYQFHISSNNGESSSILQASEQHRDFWGTTSYPRSIELEAISLPTFIRTSGLDPASFDILVLDTEGTELLVLQGAREALRHFRYIKCEAANFEAYAGSCQISDLDAFLSEVGFKQRGRFVGRRVAGGRRYWDVLYQRA